MRLQTSWRAAVDTGLVDLLRQPDQCDGIVHVGAVMEVSQDEHPVCVYDEKDYNILEWALTNDYPETFEFLYGELLDHAKKNPGDIGLVLMMMHETRGTVTSARDEYARYDTWLADGIEKLKAIPQARIGETYRPDYG